MKARVNRPRTKLASALAIGAAWAGLSAAPGLAHTTAIYHTSVGGDRALVESTHTRLYVADNECDKHGVYAQGFDSFGFYSVRDRDGCGGRSYHVPAFGFFRKYRLCEEYVSCTPWVQPT